jgi:hypothetical protein
MTIKDAAPPQQIASDTRYSTAGLTAPVRLSDLRRVNQQATSGRVSRDGGKFSFATRLTLEVFVFSPVIRHTSFKQLEAFVSSAEAVRCEA